MKNICFIGIGGVGGYFGGKIIDRLNSENIKDIRITFIARGDHLTEIQKNGLVLNTSERQNIICKPHTATDDINKIDNPDICFICVKGYDLGAVVEKLKNKIHDNTVIMPLLNGIDIYERIKEIVPGNIVLPSCVYVGTHIEKPGVVTQKGGDGKILFGKDPRRPEIDPGIMIDFLNLTGIKHEYFDDPNPSIWEKYIFISAFGLVGAFTGKTIGEMLENKNCVDMLYNVMTEIKTIAEKIGIKLPDGIMDDSMGKGKKFPFETKTSYQRDVESIKVRFPEQKGKLNEGDLFGGTIIRLGKKFNVATKVTEKLYFNIKEKTL